jgi:hypothetical protein
MNTNMNSAVKGMALISIFALTARAVISTTTCAVPTPPSTLMGPAPMPPQCVGWYWTDVVGNIYYGLSTCGCKKTFGMYSTKDCLIDTELYAKWISTGIDVNGVCTAFSNVQSGTGTNQTCSSTDDYLCVFGW